MIWQDIVFMLGSGFSVFVLMPTLRDKTSSVPWATSLPSVAIGFVYATTFYTLGMVLSAAGALAAATMWSLIARYRNPDAKHDDARPLRNRVETVLTSSLRI